MMVSGTASIDRQLLTELRDRLNAGGASPFSGEGGVREVGLRLSDFPEPCIGFANMTLSTYDNILLARASEAHLGPMTYL